MNDQERTCRAARSVWIPTQKTTGRIDTLAEVLFSKDDIDFGGDLASGWEWREYRLIPVSPEEKPPESKPIRLKGARNER